MKNEILFELLEWLVRLLVSQYISLTQISVSYTQSSQTLVTMASTAGLVIPCKGMKNSTTTLLHLFVTSLSNDLLKNLSSHDFHIARGTFN